MKGLDTNVLLRFVTADDAQQTQQVATLFAAAEDAGESFFISTIALCELSWTLRGQPYGLDRNQAASVIERILDTRLFEVQDRASVRRALADFRRGGADFPDYLLGWQCRQAGCSETVTFDRKLRGAAGFALLR